VAKYSLTHYFNDLTLLASEKASAVFQQSPSSEQSPGLTAGEAGNTEIWALY